MPLTVIYLRKSLSR